MNLLKIAGLIIGTSSIVAGTSAGIYYGVKNQNFQEAKTNSSSDDNSVENAKIPFIGKFVFEKKSDDNTNNLYIAKLFNINDYNNTLQTFNTNKTENNRYQDINKIVDISHSLNVENTKSEIKNIFGNEITLANAKIKITSEEGKLKELFGDTIYSSLNNLIS